MTENPLFLIERWGEFLGIMCFEILLKGWIKSNQKEKNQKKEGEEGEGFF